MVPVTSVPTESLYKFLAIGGIVAILACSALAVKQVQVIDTSIIKYDSSAKRYQRKVNKSEAALKLANAKLKTDTTQLQVMAALMKRGRAIMEKRAKQSLAFGTVQIEGKIFTTQEALDEYLLQERNRKILAYNRNMDTLSVVNERLADDYISLEEQNQMVEHNAVAMSVVVILWASTCLASVASCRYGFKKWQQAQTLTDTLLQLQVTKAQAEEKESNKETSTPEVA